jgi:integrase
MTADHKYMMKIKGRWHYVRRVPARYAGLDQRRRTRVGLRTRSARVARKIKALLVEADDIYWASLSLAANPEPGSQPKDKELIRAQYQAAYAWAVDGQIVRSESALWLKIMNIHALTDRLESIAYANAKREEIRSVQNARKDIENVRVSDAFKLYVSDISFDKKYGKSDAQIKRWEKTKKASLQYFLNAVGNKKLGDISRTHALRYRNWWRKRIESGVNPNTANRHIGNIRDLYQSCYDHYAVWDQKNPFGGIHFAEVRKVKRPIFPDDWVRSKILVPRLLEGLRPELVLILYTIVETGCRLSEICNLGSQDIILSHPYPHIHIQPKERREIKSSTSQRVIPLIGIACEAMKRAHKGFPAYRDREAALSAFLIQALRKRGLCPSPQHVIHSFRHSFEDRMLEAGLDYDLRCKLMGHKSARPEYGTGGSLTYRASELSRIAHPINDQLVASLPTMHYD